MSRRSSDAAFSLTDLLVVAAGAGLGLAIGYFAAERFGRVNARRVKTALARWRERHGGGDVRWSEEEAERLEARVLDALRRDAVLGRRAIRVAVYEGGIVELTGRVTHASEVDLAATVVRAVTGVRTVLNHLLVATPGAATPATVGPMTPKAARG